MTAEPWHFWLDVGGTFTDCVALTPEGAYRTRKVLSSGAVKGRCGTGSGGRVVVDPQRRGEPSDFYRGWTLTLLDERGGVLDRQTAASFDPETGTIELDREPAAGIEPGTSYELIGGIEAPVVAMRLMMGLTPDEPLGPVRVRLGTTRGTNALLERKGARVGYVATRGFADLLEIGTQARPELFELAIRRPPVLYERVAELDERIDASGHVLRPLDEALTEAALRELRDAGCTALAVCLINAYLNDEHERLVRRVADRMGFEQVSVSTELTATIKALDRGDTAVLDAYLSPVIRRYVAAIRRRMPEGTLKLMSSAGGLVEGERFAGKDSLLSGPAGGVVGFARIAEAAGFREAIGFDMGGTSTDVSRYDGRFEYRYSDEMDGVRVVAPSYAIETVAAGGGSICRYDGQRLTVGPDSGGADPGPACYGRGGPLTLTDINLYNGRIDASRFPFPLDLEAVRRRLRDIAERMTAAGDPPMSEAAIADGFTRVADLKMAGAIRQISAARGYDPAEHVLVAFGGAAPQHACAIARHLGIRRILLHPMAGVLSAYGIGMADVSRFDEQTVLKPLNAETLVELEPVFERMAASLREEVRAEGIEPERIDPPIRRLDLRYAGQQTAITVDEPGPGAGDEDWAEAFAAAHRRLYGHAHEDRPIEIATLRIEVTGRTAKPALPTAEPIERTPEPSDRRTVYFDAEAHSAAVYRRADLRPGDRFEGPTIVTEPYSTIVIEPGFAAEVTERYDLLLRDVAAHRESEGTEKAGRGADAPSGSMDQPAPVPDRPDPVRLELFNNHFTHIATRMGGTLQRTAVSVNVKERLDFSCAILDAAGNLVVNAPHIPVHLGAMGEAVKGLLRSVDDIRPGDVYLSNDPDLGGSHLPDLTVMSPVFEAGGEELLFFTASRAHHAEIGGLRPGSAFPFAARLAEEGVVLKNLRIVREGRFEEEALRRALTEAPYPSRAVEENLADIRAAMAANQLGCNELMRVIERFTWPIVDAYMRFIRDAAEGKTRAAIGRLDDGLYEFADALDDGSPVRVALRVKGDRLAVDFTGTGPVNPNSLNANRAIVQATLMYCLRCLIGEPIPLNWGVLEPIELILPECMLNPPAEPDPMKHAAVVGGNVELSQKVADVVLGALGLAAAGQGTMNNLVFGNESFGYYETIGGGAGAGPGFDGASAVHTHMTNTRLTDAEVLESRYPVRLERFAIRRGSEQRAATGTEREEPGAQNGGASGGASGVKSSGDSGGRSGGVGRYRGGDGVVRSLCFLTPVQVSLLSQRRDRAPFGLHGGGPGFPGINLLRRADRETEESLGPLAQFDAEPGDVLTIHTPGGGGYGEPNESRSDPRGSAGDDPDRANTGPSRNEPARG